jgi:hypothetical protein
MSSPALAGQSEESCISCTAITPLSNFNNQKPTRVDEITLILSLSSDNQSLSSLTILFLPLSIVFLQVITVFLQWIKDFLRFFNVFLHLINAANYPAMVFLQY